ncbi:hypothetical protein WG915_03430 [Corynebacterium sp. H128]|uniref:hypothetical protein n=1 Tax=Corynebacterium sp. H128 TaxID=3133427 RepID=UPI0030B77F59
MGAPRLNIAVVGTSSAGRALASRLVDAGHTCTHDVPWSDLGDYSAVLLALESELLPDVISRLEQTMTGKHIVLHSALGAGSDVLAELGSVAIAMHPLDSGAFVVSTSEDELSRTIAELLVSEMGGYSIRVPDAERAVLPEAQRKIAEAAQLQREALAMAESEEVSSVIVAMMG